MSKWQCTKGLHDLGRGCFAYLQPDGSWGWSNAGLVTDGEQTLLENASALILARFGMRRS
jgi:cyclase